MSIKEQMEFAKEELTQDEKLLAGLIKAEKFYRRNRTLIWALAAVVVVGGAGYLAMDYMKERRLLAANEALRTLERNPGDAGALSTLREKNPALARLLELKEAVAKSDLKALGALESAQDPLVSDLAGYHLAAIAKEAKKLEEYRMKSGALLKDYALFEEAWLLMEKGKVKEGRERLALIGENSPLAQAARLLAHYGVAPSRAGK